MQKQICDKYFKGKKVLFISTKNLDYIRNVQEINAVKKYAKECRVIGSYSKYYILRLLCVYSRILWTRSREYDVIFVGFAPQLIIPFWGWKWRQNDIVIDFFISIYDTLCFDRRKVKATGIRGRLLYAIDKKTLERAELIICDTNAHRYYFNEAFQVSKKKFSTWYLQADTSIYHPMNVNRPEALVDKFVVLYFGSVLFLQGVDIVLQAMNMLKQENKVHFIFVGPIKKKKLIKIKPVSENITYIDWLSQKSLAEYIAMADLCLAGHFNGSVQKAARTIPGKAFIYQAMGKRMILGDNPANRELFEESENIIFVQMGDAKALVNTIQAAISQVPSSAPYADSHHICHR